jgi:hypothetical protein
MKRGKVSILAWRMVRRRGSPLQRLITRISTSRLGCWWWLWRINTHMSLHRAGFWLLADWFSTLTCLGLRLSRR